MKNKKEHIKPLDRNLKKKIEKKFNIFDSLKPIQEGDFSDEFSPDKIKKQVLNGSRDGESGLESKRTSSWHEDDEDTIRIEIPKELSNLPSSPDSPTFKRKIKFMI